ncbi:hypothetical protein CENSYa_0152 [Cenarchaeum symbiosum A]|uniref:Uncharacterized protein n=1 Tax=Cenarchaeum symbiosum (strain A) TaxID=414004 RepID=A0RTY0_CENSY|nr:hypothetical protein CENSYa_0152 [Cenarchaeum symbiosum A]
MYADEIMSRISPYQPGGIRNIEYSEYSSFCPMHANLNPSMTKRWQTENPCLRDWLVPARIASRPSIRKSLYKDEPLHPHWAKNVSSAGKSWAARRSIWSIQSDT